MILGVDPGERRIGLAVADADTRFARPLEVIDVATTDPVARIAELADELDAALVVVGRPTTLSGAAGAAVERQEELVARLRAALDVTVVDYDERLTTVVAERSLREAGVRPRKRRHVRDAVAAQVMLQDYMDSTA